MQQREAADAVSEAIKAISETRIRCAVSISKIQSVRDQMAARRARGGK